LKISEEHEIMIRDFTQISSHKIIETREDREKKKTLKRKNVEIEIKKFETGDDSDKNYPKR